MRRKLRLPATGLVLALALAASAAGPAGAGAGPDAVARDNTDGVRPANFDDDPFDDLAIGAPDGAVGGAARAGRVTVLFAGNYPGGPMLGAGGRLDLQQGTGATTLPGQPEAGDRYGAAVTGGSYHRSDRNTWDGDSDEDVAIGAPGETVAGARGAGAVTIVWAYQYFEHERLLWQGHAGIGGIPQPGDAFGAAVA